MIEAKYKMGPKPVVHLGGNGAPKILAENK